VKILRLGLFQLLALVVGVAQVGCHWFGVSDNPNHAADLQLSSSRVSFASWRDTASIACRNAGRLSSGRIFASLSPGFRIIDDSCSNRTLAPGAACALTVAPESNGSGVLTLQSAPGGRVQLSLQSDLHVTITPAVWGLRTGELQRFTADADVDWSVAEGDAGGLVGVDGQYTAPLTPGTYHLVATLRSDRSRTATAAIAVRGWVLDVLAGELGGVGDADGVGADARFNSPYGIISDQKGKLYIADTQNYTIRQVVVATGQVTTLAGAPGRAGAATGIGTAARFFQPMGLALDGGTLFIADSGNQMIRSLNLASGGVSWVAGEQGVQGSDDSGGVTNVRFSVPTGLALDAAGNLYVADADNDRVRRISFTNHGAATTTLRDQSGNPLYFNEPWGLASDGKGALYVGRLGDGLVTKVQLGAIPTVSDVTDGSGMAIMFNLASSVALDAAGTLYVSESSVSNPLVELTPGAGAISTLINSNPSTFTLAYGGSDNRLYLADQATVGSIGTPATSGAVTPIAGRAGHPGNRDGAVAQASFNQPTSMVYDGGDEVYILDSGSRAIRKLHLPTGEVSTLVAETGDWSPFVRPFSLTSDRHGNLYVIDGDRSVIPHTIRKIATATGAVSIAYTGIYLSSLAADDAGNFYVGSYNTIVRISAASGATQILAGTANLAGKTDSKDGQALFGHLQGLLWDGASTLYVADDSAIRTVSTVDGTTTTIAGIADQPGDLDGTGSRARFSIPRALALDSAGVLYIGDNLSSTVRRMDLKTMAVVTWIGAPNVGIVRPGPLPAAINQPSGIAVVRGELLLIDTNENALLHVH
jgi:sugar lactone lactonase YvrE